MKVLINTAHQRFGGNIQVALSFIHECRKFPRHEYIIWVGPGVHKSLDESLFPDNFRFVYFDFGVINLRKTFRINRILKEQEAIDKPDVIISTAGPTYFHSEAPQIIGYNLVLYIYPESPYIQELSFIRKVRMKIKRRIHFYFLNRDASAFVVQTDDVNERVQKAFRTSEVYTVTNTCNGYYVDPQIFPNKLPQNSEKMFRFLTVSSYYRHKNLELIPLVIQELHDKGVENVEFVLTLKEIDFNKYIGQHPKIHNIGPVSPEECPSLYMECDGMFLPTLAECFSASYPEAMKMKKPIITTDLGFARSICGKAAFYFVPKNAKAAAGQIEKLVRNKILQQELIEYGEEQLKMFDTPQERAGKYIELCEKLVGFKYIRDNKREIYDL